MEGDNGRPTGFINNLVDTFGRVIAWGVMLIIMITIVSAIGIGMLRCKVKYAIDYTLASAVDYAKFAVLDDPEFTQKIKDNAKEAVEYSFRKIKKNCSMTKLLTEKYAKIQKKQLNILYRK